MKIELKHLAPYLPYGLQVQYEYADKLVEDKLIAMDASQDLIFMGFKPWTNIADTKPILRPLSDLTKEIEHNGEKFMPYKKLLEGQIKDGKHYRDILYCIQPAKYYIMLMPYHAMEKLFEWHFNVFDLPEELYVKKETLTRDTQG